MHQLETVRLSWIVWSYTESLLPMHVHENLHLHTKQLIEFIFSFFCFYLIMSFFFLSWFTSSVSASFVPLYHSTLTNKVTWSCNIRLPYFDNFLFYFFFSWITSSVPSRGGTNKNLLKRKGMETELPGFRNMDEVCRGTAFLCDTEWECIYGSKLPFFHWNQCR